jgi:hypothetical protein
MDSLNTGGDNDSASALNASPRPKPDISATLRQLRASLQAWKLRLTQGEVESLVAKVDAQPAGDDLAVRMLTINEQQQLRATKVQLHQYQQCIVPTPIID